MIMQPALPKFFFDTLHLSYAELAIALSVCKGVGFSMTTKYWSWLMGKLDIFRFGSIVTVLCAFFPLALAYALSPSVLALYGLSAPWRHAGGQ
jgi:hypothetical protein